MIERDPVGSGSYKVPVLRQDESGAISAPPGGLISIDAAPFSHPVIRWLGGGIPVGRMDSQKAEEWKPGAVVVLWAAGLTARIPLAVLAGIALRVDFDIIDWSFLKRAHRVSHKAAWIMYRVIALTVFVDLYYGGGHRRVYRESARDRAHGQVAEPGSEDDQAS